MSDVLFFCEIPGRPIVKKNTKRFYGKGRVVYSPKYISWENHALAHLKQCVRMKPINFAIEANFTFYFENRQAEADVSNLLEGVQDALTKAGVIHDDRFIHLIIAKKIFGHEPKTIIELKGLA